MTIHRIAGIIIGVLAIALVVAVAIFVTGTPGSVYSEEPEHAIAPASTSGEPTSITVKEGQSAKSIGNELEAAHVVRSSELFEVLVGLTGVQDALQAGDYEFDPGLPAMEVVRRIANGETASRDVLIPEGARAEEVGEALEKAGIVKKQDFLNALVKSRHEQPFLAESTSPSLEGYLFPARYTFSRETTPDQAVDRLLQGFQDNVADKVQLEGQGLTLDQVVTLASIVEREAATISERPRIASVYLNRLRLGIALQADPTVQYALGNDPASVARYGYWKKELTLDDLKADSPYNTYVNAGLPPGPISNPSLDTIEAVIRPEQTNYLYFVAKGDGTHAFAETLEEHLQNVEKYQGSGQ